MLRTLDAWILLSSRKTPTSALAGMAIVALKRAPSVEAARIFDPSFSRAQAEVAGAVRLARRGTQRPALAAKVDTVTIFFWKETDANGNPSEITLIWRVSGLFCSGG